MGKRGRRRGAQAPPVPTAEYRDAEGGVLVLRAALPPAARREYADTLASGTAREDAWQRALELLFERLAVSWEIAGAEPIAKQRDLLARYRFASQEERRFVRDSLRAHLAEHFPEMEAV